jgi:hypothetical protein
MAYSNLMNHFGNSGLNDILSDTNQGTVNGHLGTAMSFDENFNLQEFTAAVNLAALSVRGRSPENKITNLLAGTGSGPKGYNALEHKQRQYALILTRNPVLIEP